MVPLDRRPPYVQLLTAVAAAVACNAVVHGATVDDCTELLPAEDCMVIPAADDDEVVFLTVSRMLRSRSPRISMEPSAVPSHHPAPPAAESLAAQAEAIAVPSAHPVPSAAEPVAAQADAHAQMTSAGRPISVGPIFLAEEKAITATSGGFAFSSPGDAWLPTIVNPFRGSAGSTVASQFFSFFQALAQAPEQVWLACLGGITIVFALSRARAFLKRHNREMTKAFALPARFFPRVVSTSVSWRVDHRVCTDNSAAIVRSSAINSAG